MEIDALLCTHAESVNNQLYLMGGAVDIGFASPGSQPPYGSSLAVAVVITVPWTATNAQHVLTIDLFHEDGQPVQLPTGPDTTGPLHVEMAFNVGRPPILTAGDEQRIPVAGNFPNLPLPALGKYVVAVAIDGTNMKNLPYRLLMQPGSANMTGPAAPGFIGH